MMTKKTTAKKDAPTPKVVTTDASQAVDPADVTTFQEDDNPTDHVGELVDDGPIKADD